MRNNQMKNFRDATSVIPTQMDIRPWILYDRVDLEAGDIWPERRRHIAFRDPIGPDRGFESTNMRLSQCLPAPMQFLVQAIYCLYSPHYKSTAVFHGMDWTLVVGNKSYGQSPLPFIALPGSLDSKDGVQLRPEAVQAPHPVSDDLGEINKEERNTWITPSTMWPASEKGLVTIEMQQCFSLELEGELKAGSEPLTMWFCLEGLLARGVQ